MVQIGHLEVGKIRVVYGIQPHLRVDFNLAYLNTLSALDMNTIHSIYTTIFRVRDRHNRSALPPSN